MSGRSGGLQLTCYDDCVEASFDHVFLNISLASIPWTTLTVIGIIAGQLFPVRVKSARVRLSVYEYGLISSGTASAYAVILASVGQIIMFFFRANYRRIDSTQHGLEMIAAMIALADVVTEWMFVCTQGPASVVRFALDGRLIAGSLVVTSVVSVAMSPIGSSKSWFSFTFLSSYRLMQAMSYFDTVSAISTRVKWKRQLFLKVLVFVLYVYCAAGAIMTLELAGEPMKPEWNAMGALVFVFTTVSTLGNSPVVPTSVLGRLLSIVLTLWGLWFAWSSVLPNLNNIMLDANIGVGEYRRNRRRKNRQQHILVCGSPGSRMVRDFLEEIYHENHFEGIHDFDRTAVDVVVLVQNEETLLQLRALLKGRSALLYRSRVTLLKGEAFNPEDLERSKLMYAAQAFVLPNLVIADVACDDKANIMRALALGTAAPNVPVLCMLHRVEFQPSKLEFQGSLVRFISIDAFKLPLLAKGCLTKGAMACILNLCKSTGEYKIQHGARAWLSDYQHSVGGELYEEALATLYNGCSFGEVCVDVLQRSAVGEVVLIGIVEEKYEDGSRTVLIHPGIEYIIDFSACEIYGIFIAPDVGKIKQMGDKGSDATWETHAAVTCGDSPRLKGRKKTNKAAETFDHKLGTNALDDMAELERLRKAARPTEAQAEKQFAEEAYAKATTSVKRTLLTSGVEVDIITGIADTLGNADDVSKPKTAGEKLTKGKSGRPKRPKSAIKNPSLRTDQEDVMHELHMMHWQRDIMDYTAAHCHEPLPKSAFGDHLLLCIVSDTTASVDHLRASRSGVGPAIGIQYFMSVLRDKRTRGAFQPTVIVLADFLPADWASVAHLDRVYFVKGSPLRLGDLDRANFRTARAVAVARGHLSCKSECYRVADANVLMATTLIEVNMPGTSTMPVIVDLSFDGSCFFLPESKVQVEPPATSPAMNLPKILKSIGQLFFKESDDRVILEDDFSPPPPEENYEDLPSIDYAFHYRFMTGQVFIASAMMAFLANSFYNKTFVPLVTAFLDAPMLLLPLPSLWERRSYADLAVWMLKKRNLLALGIYRSAHAAEAGIGKQLEETLPSHHYIFTAPPAYTTLVVPTDYILCLAPTVPEDNDDVASP